ncbi:MAG TPA: ankyrin repeat domain-containing protein, partial [Candidatus Saccharimonadales bacterium]|nr:ankyrin repeat domain-containing protein [Candidatus Saccharimonadales bacterium]
MKKRLFNILFFYTIINSNVILPSLSADKPKQPDFALTTKFFDAVIGGNVEEVQQLLAQGVSKDIYNNGVGDTALIVATRHQKREMVKFLIEQGFDKNAKNLIGHSPLLIAAQNNDTDGIRDLCCLGTQEVDVHTADGLQNTPLHIVADNDNYNGVFVLLKHGKACPYKRNSFGKAPLHIASARGALNAVKSLLTYGDKQFELLDNGGRTPLYWAIANENYDVAEKLMREVYNPNYHKFKTALEKFVIEGNVRAIQKLLDMGARKHVVDRQTLLHLAAEHGHVPVLRVLIDAGLKIDSRTFMGHTPLHKAATQGHVEVVQILLAAGADKNAKTYFVGDTVLHHAAETGSVPVVQLLLAAGADKNARTEFGENALHFAARKGNIEALKILLDAGVDRNIVDDMRRTPRDLAQNLDRTQAAKFLKEYQPAAAAVA